MNPPYGVYGRVVKEVRKAYHEGRELFFPYRGRLRGNSSNIMHTTTAMYTNIHTFLQYGF